jgi:hypothetical protein
MKWKVFSSHLSSSISDLLTGNSFSDVTLVSDDLIQFKAHKCVLSACSPVLKNLLLNNSHSYPLIYLRGVKQKELQSILQFIYLGEARFYVGNMDKFMEAVNDLQIKVYPFFNREEHAEDVKMSSTTSDPDILTTIDEENEKDKRSISSTVDEILKLDIMADINGVESSSQVYNCEECDAVFKSKQGLYGHTNSKHEGFVYSCKVWV